MKRPRNLYPGAPGRFEKTPWSRGEDEGGGVMGMMRGRLFEKVGVHTSTVFGAFSPEFARSAGAARRSALLGQRHQPDRAYEESARAGGAYEHPHDRHHQKLVRRRRRSQSHPRIVAHAAPSRHGGFPCPAEEGLRRFRHRLVSQIQEMGRQLFLAAASRRAARGRRHLLRQSRQRRLGRATSPSPKRWAKPFSTSSRRSSAAAWTRTWTEEERHEQAKWRGRYVEFNLLYDRGTTFGLKVGGNIEGILSSMPPVAEWR